MFILRTAKSDHQGIASLTSISPSNPEFKAFLNHLSLNAPEPLRAYALHLIQNDN
jgi:hypothetical protein